MTNNTMTLREYFKEAEAYEYSKEYFDLVKESIEIDLLALYLENYEYMEECVEWGEEIHESVSFMFMEDGNEEVKEETIASKAKAFFEKIWKGIIRILKAIITPFTALYTYLKNFLNKAKVDDEIRAKRAEELIAEREKDIERRKAKGDEKSRKNREELEKDREEEMEKLAEVRKKELENKEKELESKAKNMKFAINRIKYCMTEYKTSYLKAFKLIGKPDIIKELNVGSYLAPDAEKKFNSLSADLIEDKECAEFIRNLNRYRFSRHIIVPVSLESMERYLYGSDNLSIFIKDLDKLCDVITEDVKKNRRTDPSELIRRLGILNREILKNIDSEEITIMTINDVTSIDVRIAEVTEKLSIIYKKMEKYYQQMQEKKHAVYTKLDYTKFGKLMQGLFNIQKRFTTATVKIKKTIDEYAMFKNTCGRIVEEAIGAISGDIFVKDTKSS